MFSKPHYLVTELRDKELGRRDKDVTHGGGDVFNLMLEKTPTSGSSRFLALSLPLTTTTTTCTPHHCTRQDVRAWV